MTLITFHNLANVYNISIFFYLIVRLHSTALGPALTKAKVRLFKREFLITP